VLAGLVVKRFENRREDARGDRDKEAALRRARADFVARASRIAGAFYMEMQNFRRGERDPDIYGRSDEVRLNEHYLAFAKDAGVLENELGFWFGEDGRPRVLWHQILDVLTVRYFWLRGRATDPLLRANARTPGTADTQPTLHSGLTFRELRKATADTAADSPRSAPAQRLLDTYHAAMVDLAGALDVTGQRGVKDDRS